MKKALIFLIVFLSFYSLSKLSAQTATESMPSMEFDMTEFPQWTKDLRRAEIIAFGSFPFMYFFSNFAFDTYRWSNNGWDTRYAPWPITSAGAIGQTKDEKIMTLGIAAGAAILVALVDYGITAYKRYKLEKSKSEIETIPPVIIRTPLEGASIEGTSIEGSGSENTESALPITE